MKIKVLCVSVTVDGDYYRVLLRSDEDDASSVVVRCKEMKYEPGSYYTLVLE